MDDLAYVHANVDPSTTLRFGPTARRGDKGKVVVER